MFTVVATFAIFLYITWERTLNDKYEEVKALSSFLDKQLDDTVLEIISAPNLTNDEKIQHLNVALQPSIDNVTASYENVGAGYYIKPLNTIVAFGPDFSPSGLIDISPESQARTVYKTAQDFEFHNYSQTREGFVIANIHPLIRNGEIIGHSWGNVLLDDVLTMFKDDFLTFLSILAAMLLIAFIGSHLITKQFKKSLALFKNHILHNEPLPENVRFSHDFSEVYDAYTCSRKALVESEQRFKDVVNSFDGFVWEIDKDGNYTFVSSRMNELIGYEAEELLHVNVFQLLDKENHKIIKQAFEQSLQNKRGFKDVQFQQQRKDGQYVYLSSSCIVLLDEQGDVVRFRGATRDITVEKENEAHIHHLAFYDQLTGLPNRTSLNRDLTTFIEQDEPFAVLFIDLDQFKTVNDTLGHQIGDTLITTVAQRLQNTLQTNDRIYRFGGDEFIVVLRDYQTVDDLKVKTSKLLDAATSPLTLAEQTFHTSISVGISIFKEHGTTADALIRFADLAMYKAKNAGKNQYMFFDASLEEQAEEEFEISNLLVQALAENQFELYYQPQVDLKSGQICGLEALVRWHHPTKGFISPAKFIPVAESSGMIVQLGYTILQAACKMRKQLLDQGIDTIRVAVNISLKQFQQEDFIDQVLEILAATDLPGQYLELEITESIAMDSPEIVIKKLNELRAYNIDIAIDDFGMGYSSLNYLKRLPIQQLKIDRAFIQDIDQQNDYAIVKSIISIAESLSLRVVAEGVETELQLAKLKSLHCDIIQGFYYYKPKPAEEIFALLNVTSEK